MPNGFYLVRLIHSVTHRPVPGRQLWTAQDLARASVVRSLRERNELGFNIYLWPYAQGHNAGYIFLDLDQARPQVFENMRTSGHEPCVVLQTSPGHLQAWVRVSTTPLEPALATMLGRLLAERYGGDRASTDWRHLGRLAGFANRKPARCAGRASPHWVQLLHAEPVLASAAQKSLAVAQECLERLGSKARAITLPSSAAAASSPHTPEEPGAAPRTSLTRQGAAAVYQRWVQRWRIPQRFPQLDWSVVDLWLARKLLAQHTPPAQVMEILRLGSPHFPRDHGDPEDYLRRTLARAALPHSSPRPVCGEIGSDSLTSANRA
jgi:RepB DNA-primase N-terminal domain/RepB DNA-primase C-terminal helical domain